MQCSDFESRLHQLLDEHRSAGADAELQQHASHCLGCRRELETWCRIAAVLDATGDPPTYRHSEFIASSARSRVRTPAALVALTTAAVLLLVLTWSSRGPSDSLQLSQTQQPREFVKPSGAIDTSTQAADSSVESPEGASAVTEDEVTGRGRNRLPDGSRHRNASIRSAKWWNDVQPASWVNQTMPTVRSVKQGVAPIGRTIVRAMTLLTVGGGNPTS